MHLYKLILVALILGGHSLLAQDAKAGEYQVKAVFLYNFAHFVDWKTEIFESPSIPFVIGLLGNDPFGNFIDETVKEEKVLGHIIKVIRFTSIQDVKNCQILFINSNDSRYVRDVIASVRGKKVLTVSDLSNFVDIGGIIQFFLENNKIRLKINLISAKENGLNISSKLLWVSQIINN